MWVFVFNMSYFSYLFWVGIVRNRLKTLQSKLPYKTKDSYKLTPKAKWNFSSITKYGQGKPGQEKSERS